MHTIEEHIAKIRATLPQGVGLLCVSKFQPVEAIRAACEAGERDFGESRVQELLIKQEALPKDIRWHFIGHLQTNKVKQIVPFVHLIHSVDSEHLLRCIDREAEKIGRTVDVLLELHVAREESKTGFTPEELDALIRVLQSDENAYPHIRVRGVMGMATNTDDVAEWRRCFREIAAAGKRLGEALGDSTGDPMVISMGMSEDYPIAVEEGSTMVRIGSSIFGARDYTTAR
ncbi:MAG: YggS family pyridoxal phosphate-dependent enzyme [Paludibacteraceae bacterium]|nr:YggS family pyridoxal phosphate-dependent enzyme [Paludibacteraceae bacterium]